MPARRYYPRKNRRYRRFRRRPMYRRGYKRRSYTRRRRYTRVFRVKRPGAISTIPIYDTASQNAFVTFALSDVENAVEFTNVWKEFKITAAVVRFTWRQGPSTVNSSFGIPQQPTLHWAIDPSGDNSATTISTIAEYANHHSKLLGEPMTLNIKLYPKPLIAMYKTVGGFGTAARSTWIKVADATTPHFGLRYCVDGSANGGIGENILGYMDMQIYYYLAFKLVH